MSVVNSFIEKNQSRDCVVVSYIDFIPGVEKYLFATKDYAKFDDENGDEYGEFNSDDYEEVDMEEEEAPKNEPDEDGWTVVK